MIVQVGWRRWLVGRKVKKKKWNFKQNIWETHHYFLEPAAGAAKKKQFCWIITMKVKRKELQIWELFWVSERVGIHCTATAVMWLTIQYRCTERLIAVARGSSLSSLFLMFVVIVVVDCWPLIVVIPWLFISIAYHTVFAVINLLMWFCKYLVTLTLDVTRAVY